MTRDERIEEMLSKRCFINWSRKDCEDELSDLTDEEISNGYAIFNFDGTGMLEIEALGCIDAFECDDEKAVQKAIEDGVKIIPIDELPANFDRRYLGLIHQKIGRKLANIVHCYKTIIC